MSAQRGSSTELHIVIEGNHPKIELKGSASHILIAWGWLTLAICGHCGVAVERMAERLPWLVGTLQSSLRGITEIDLGAVDKLRRDEEHE